MSFASAPRNTAGDGRIAERRAGRVDPNDPESAPHDPGIVPQAQSQSASQSLVSFVTSPTPSRVDLYKQLSLQEPFRLKEEKTTQKELMKALETPEEKRARRLAKLWRKGRSATWLKKNLRNLTSGSRKTTAWNCRKMSGNFTS